MQTFKAAEYKATHFKWECDGKVATVTLNRPERKNPLTFESYAELRDLFRQLVHATDIKWVVVTGAGGNFCSAGDVHEIIGPLVRMQEAAQDSVGRDQATPRKVFQYRMRHRPEWNDPGIVQHTQFIRQAGFGHGLEHRTLH